MYPKGFDTSNAKRNLEFNSGSQRQFLPHRLFHIAGVRVYPGRVGQAFELGGAGPGKEKLVIPFPSAIKILKSPLSVS